MRMLILIPLVFSLVVPGWAEATREPATRTLLSSCAEAKPVVIAFFAERGFMQSAEPSCPECVEFKSDSLQDASGHKIAARRIVQDYVDSPTQEKHPFGVWTSYSKPLTKASLRLTSASGGCLVSLLFDYTWTSTQVVAAIPRDGDPESRPSNRRLERQYLDSITIRVMHTP